MSVQSESNIYSELFLSEGKKIAVLIDPDKHTSDSIKYLINASDKAAVDFFMIGSSLLLNAIDKTICEIKKLTSTPLVLFPGNLLQLSDKVDAMLLLSLISGRNPELLIGNHVISAPIIKKSGLIAISTGYMLIGSGNITSVEYMSNTVPIPRSKTDIAVATAMAGELIGMKLIYLDAGSGAEEPVPSAMIRTVKSNLSIPLIIGGGLKTKQQITNACSAGADILVVGNVLEDEQNIIAEFAQIVHNF